MAKGTQYENETAEAIEAELARGDYGLDPALAKLRRKPSYFSRDRDKAIVFDISIELSRRGATAPYWVWVLECKNYSHTVPVDDVEEFHAKLSQVGADRTKGTIITPLGFDSGALAFAMSKGIGLWRYVPSGSIVRLMENSRGVETKDILIGLTTPDTTAFRSYGWVYGLTTTGEFSTDEKELRVTEFRDV